MPDVMRTVHVPENLDTTTAQETQTIDPFLSASSAEVPIRGSVSMVNQDTDPTPSLRCSPRPPQLDERLRTAADWVIPCETCADIGCDHGRFGAVLLTEGRCQRLLAADISDKALSKAKVRLSALGFSQQTVFAVADGLSALDALPDGHADTVCILGMGGETVAGILRRGASRLQGATLILGAQTELFLTRDALQQIGYRLVDERAVTVDGRLYLLMCAQPAPADAPPYDERALLLGPCLLASHPPAWKPWLMRRHRLLTAAIHAAQQATNAMDSARLASMVRELQYVHDALATIQP